MGNLAPQFMIFSTYDAHKAIINHRAKNCGSPTPITAGDTMKSKLSRSPSTPSVRSDESFETVDCTNIANFIYAYHNNAEDAVKKKRYTGERCRVCKEEGPVAGLEEPLPAIEKKDKKAGKQYDGLQSNNADHPVNGHPGNGHVKSLDDQEIISPSDSQDDAFINEDDSCDYNPIFIAPSLKTPPSDGYDEVLIQVCDCVLSQRYVHESCLILQINTLLDDNCPQCGRAFLTTSDWSRPFLKWKFSPITKGQQCCKLLGSLVLAVILGVVVATVAYVVFIMGLSKLISIPLIIILLITYVFGLAAGAIRMCEALERVLILNCPPLAVKPIERTESELNVAQAMAMGNIVVR